MEAVKMPSTSQVKSQIRTASADVPKGGDEFMKLLQTKKEQIQPDKADAKPTDGKDSQKDDKDVSQLQDKKEDSDQGEETTHLEDMRNQDVLLQAAMQQTAAQMAGIIEEQPDDQLAEPVEEVLAASLEPVSAEETTWPGQETAGESAIGETIGESEKKNDASADNGAEQNRDDVFKALNGEKTQTKEQAVPIAEQTASKPKEKVQTDEKTDSQGRLYGAAAGETDREHIFTAQKTEEIPLKTSQDTLPQDLGKTLADRFPGTGRELVVELEPANLGKLTIKMVYEAGRAAVSILATNPRTLEILNQKAAEIASILEEKTGQETIIYTEAPQQESQEENPDQKQGGQSRQEGQGDQRQAGKGQQHDAESFAQQLRLGLL